MQHPLHDSAFTDDDELIRLVDVESPLACAWLRMPSDDADVVIPRAFTGHALASSAEQAQQRLRSAIARYGPSQGLAAGHARHSV
jgi:hypothetical protein